MHKATQTTNLPQYINSQYSMEGFLDALHDPDGELKVSQRYRGLKFIGEKESKLDGLEYFSLNKKRLEKEFSKECSNLIGKKKTHKYFDVISNTWYEGRSLRTGEHNYPLLKSIEKYFTHFKRIRKDQILVRNQPDFGKTDLLFEPDVLDQIFMLNNRLTNWCFQDWISRYYPRESFGTNDIYIRRGVVLDDKDYNGAIFYDQNYLNSYSLSITVGEQFSQSGEGNPSIFNLAYNNCLDRILFFSPFIKNLNNDLVEAQYEQLELGLVPPYSKMQMTLQDKHDNVSEYILNYLTQY